MTDLEESVRKNESLTEENKKLKSRNIAGNTRISEMRKIISKMNKDSANLRRLLNDAKSNRTSLENDLLESASQCEEFESEIEKLKHENSALRKKIGSTSNSIIQLRKEVTSLSANRDKLNESIERTRTESRKLDEVERSNSALKRRLALTENNYKSKLKSEKKLTEQVEGLGRELGQSKIEIKRITEGYLTLVSRTSGISKSSIMKQLPKNYGIKDIDTVVEEMRSQRDRINKMPIAMESVGIAFSKSTPDSQEIAQTKSILRSMKT
jgi:chromosome segregation ATPase